MRHDEILALLDQLEDATLTYDRADRDPGLPRAGSAFELAEYTKVRTMVERKLMAVLGKAAA